MASLIVIEIRKIRLGKPLSWNWRKWGAPLIFRKYCFIYRDASQRLKSNVLKEYDQLVLPMRNLLWVSRNFVHKIIFICSNSDEQLHFLILLFVARNEQSSIQKPTDSSNTKGHMWMTFIINYIYSKLDKMTGLERPIPIRISLRIYGISGYRGPIIVISPGYLTWWP